MKKIIHFIFQITINFGILLVAYWFSKIFNIIDYIDFIPKDKKLEISVSLYTAIGLKIIELVNEYLENIKTKIQIIAYDKGKEPDINNIPQYAVGQINIEMWLEGNLEVLNKMDLVLDLPNWVQVQYNLGRQENGSFKISLKKIMNISRTTGRLEKKKIIVKIPTIYVPIATSHIDLIKIKVEKEPYFFFSIENNSFKLKCVN